MVFRLTGMVNGPLSENQVHPKSIMTWKKSLVKLKPFQILNLVKVLFNIFLHEFPRKGRVENILYKMNCKFWRAVTILKSFDQ